MHELVYPTLDLFSYDSRNSLGDTEEVLNRKLLRFQRKLPEVLHKELCLQESSFEDDYQELLPSYSGRRFDFRDKVENLAIQGYYYPVRLNDAYSLLLDSSVDNYTDPIPVDECFAQLKSSIEARLNGEQSSIGHTWMLSGWVPENLIHADKEKIARACYKSIFPKAIWKQDIEGKGTFLGASIFELWHYRSTQKETLSTDVSVETLSQNRHVIIIIFPNRLAAEKAADFYDDWLRLFSFRNKILWAYSQSQLAKQIIKDDFMTAQDGHRRSQSFDDFRATLSEIRDSLSRYRENLRRLDLQGCTVDINLGNYKKRLRRIEKETDADTDITLFKEFSDVVENKYLLQIRKDSEIMRLCLRLLEDEIAATRSRLEISKAERDQSFRRMIKYLGTGWATATVVSETVDFQNIPKGLGTQKLPSEIAFALPLFYTILIAVAVAGLVGISTYVWNFYHRS